MKEKKWPVLDITGFFFRMSTQVKAKFFRMSTQVKAEAAFKWVLVRKKKPVISNTGKIFCFNNNVSNLYNNSVVEKINVMAYVFTLLLFRKPNKTTINKNKTTIFIGQRPFDSRLYLDISRSFKCPKSSPVVCLICYYLRSVR